MASNLGVRSVCAVLLALLSFVLASPLFPTIPTTENGHVSDLKPRAGDFYLRIMPLGASITYGDPHQDETGGRGYRKYLRDKLRYEGWDVNMVGSRRYGEDFADNDVEGWPGFTIDGVYDKAELAVPKYKPNVIMLNAGTNDATGGTPGGAGERLERLVRRCLEQSPGVTILMSTLLPNALAPDNVVNINKQYRAVAAKLRLEGKKVQLAEMNNGFITVNDLWDGTHPYGGGFMKMAAVWWGALELADAKNWLSPPSQDVSFKDGDTTSDKFCDKEFGSGNSAPGSGDQILYATDPLIANDGNYRHSSQAMGKNPGLSFAGPGRETKVSFANIVNPENADRGGERDELIYVIRTNAGTSLARMHRNYGDGSFEDVVPLSVNMDCDWDGGEWVDMNNDGFDDFVCITPEGHLDLAINLGNGNGYFRNLGRIKNSETSDRAHVRLADIDGDGRFDYCVTDDGGNIRCWRNGGIGDTPGLWQDLGVVFTGKGMGDIGGTRFVDINGDGRSDWLWVDNTGKVTTYINQRGYDKSLVPLWLEAGVTHQGMGTTVGREKIHFGRIYGSSRRDYARRTATDLGDDVWQYGMEVYKNTGVGGKHQKGDGARWGPMSGKGNDDYIWISPDGKIVPFVNKNTPPDTTQYKNGWAAKGVVLETGMDRKALHIGDWDGDGKADIIGVDKKTGALTVWFTGYTGPGGTFSFRKETLGGTWCTQGWGVGLFDIGARFADVSGNGCVDYLCMEPDGRTTGWINNCPRDGNNFNLENVGQIKKSEGLDRANHKWADVNGDGKADFLWTDKFNGDAKYWSNTGRVPESDRPNQGGSIFHFDPKGTSYLGSSRGANIHYPNLGGLGRADQVSIQPATGYGWVWYNTCAGGGGGDDGGIAPRDPSLPRYDAPFSPLCPFEVPVCDLFPAVPLSCQGDSYGQDFSDPTWEFPESRRVPTYYDLDNEERGPLEPPEKRRRSDNILYNETVDIQVVHETDLAKRKGSERRAFAVEFRIAVGFVVQLFFWARGYPGTTHLHDPTNSQPASNHAFRMRDACTSSEVEVVDRTTLTVLELAGFDTEHNPDLQFARDFLYTLGTGILPDGTRTSVPPIDPTVLEAIWNTAQIPPGVIPSAGSSRKLDSINEVIMDCFGSQGNRAPMVLCEKSLNQLKGRTFNLRPVDPPNFWDQDNFDQLLEQSLYDSTSRNGLFRMINMVVGVFRFINHTQMRPRVQTNVSNLQQAIDRLEALFPQDLAGAGQIFREFAPNWYGMATLDTRAWLRNRLEEMSDFYAEHRRIAVDPLEVQQFIQRILDEIDLYINSPI